MYLPINRSQSRKLGIIAIAAGILLLPDIIAPTPMMDVLLNIPLALFISAILSISFLSAMSITFLIAFALIAFGLLVYPYNTKRLFMGKLKAGIGFCMANPLLVAAAVIVFLIVLNLGTALSNAYSESIRIYIMEELAPLINGG